MSEQEALREAIRRDRELESGAVMGRSHEEVMQVAGFFSREPWQGSGPAETAANHDDFLYGP